MNNTIKKISLLISRFFAIVLDIALITLVLTFYFEEFSITNQADFINSVLKVLLFYEVYFFVFEFLFKMTPGKFVFGLRTRLNLKNESFSKSVYFLTYLYENLIRTFSRILIFIPPLFIWNELLILIFFNGRSFSEIISKLRVEFKS